MPTGITKLSRVQFAKEVTPGTPVAATTRWRGKGPAISDDRTIEQIEEWIGIIHGADRTAVTGLAASLQLASVPMTPEQLPYLFAMLYGGPTAGTADGVGTDKIYTTNIPTTAKPTIVPYTVEAGDDFEAERMEYCVCTKVDITGAMGQTAKMAGLIQGKQTTRMAGGFTAGATIPACSELVVNNGKTYIDLIGGVYGATQVVTTIIGFKLTFEAMWVRVPTMDGSLALSYWSYTDQKVTGDITFLHDTPVSGSGGAKADMRAQTPKLFRLDLIGDLAATGGTTYQNKRVIFDLPAKYTKIAPLADNSGNSMVVMSIDSRYNVTAGNAGKIICVNELATLP